MKEFKEIKEKEIKNVKEKLIGVISKVKEIKKIKNLNELARNMQNKTAYWLLAGLGVFIFTGWFFMFSAPSHGDKSAEKAKKLDTKQESAQLAGAVDAQFTQESSSKALDKQQQEIKSLNEKLSNLSDQLDFLQKTLDEKNHEEINDNKVALQELQTKTAELEEALKRS
jgi:valyl-tRNA synthetase